jgi:branched-chain amino acid transport system substrate-binding protein
MGAINGGGERVLTVGVVTPRPGRPTMPGNPLGYVLTLLAPGLAEAAPPGFRIRLVPRDSGSGAEEARKAVAGLAEDEQVHMVVTLAGPGTLPAVTDECEERGMPCVSSCTYPWQVHHFGSGGRSRDTDGGPREWTYHFGWGLDDMVNTFADLWELACGPEQKVGCLWNDGPQGTWSRDPLHGFGPVVRARGHKLLDPAAYREPADDLDTHVAAFKDAKTRVVTSAATGKDLRLLRARAAEEGWQPDLITCSRRLSAPPRDTVGGDRPPHADVATVVHWSPSHPYRSSIDGMTTGALAAVYERDTGRRWPQPLGLAHALIEVALHAMHTADDPTDRASLAAALRRARLDTMAGTLDWTAGPVPGIATVPLAGGQWQREERQDVGRQHGGRHGYELRIVTSGHIPGLHVDAELVTM